MEVDKEMIDLDLNKANYNLASPWSRIGAYLLDIIPIIILVNIIFYFLFDINPFNKSGETIILEGFEVEKAKYHRSIIRYSSLLIWIFYSIVMDASVNQGTFGKKLLNIKVIDVHGNKLTIQKSIIRNLFKLISYIAIFLGFVWIIFDKKKRGWHDIVAKSLIIENKNDH